MQIIKMIKLFTGLNLHVKGKINKGQNQIVGPGGLCAPWVLACTMRSLDIVITIVQSFSLSSFFFLHLLL